MWRRLLNPNEPLGLPNGSIRAILAVMFTGVTLFLWSTTGEPDVALVAITTSIVGNYFGMRGSAEIIAIEPPLPKPYVPDEDTTN